MKIQAYPPEEYLSKLPEERKDPINQLRKIINDNLPSGFIETMNSDMLSYVVPKSKYPAGYHCTPELPLPFMNIASQKNFIGFYHMGIYANKELLDWFVEEYPKHCKYKLDMGKSCIRFKKMNDIPYDLLAELVKKITADEWIELYEKNIKK
jgi:hypothetical protein